MFCDGEAANLYCDREAVNVFLIVELQFRQRVCWRRWSSSHKSFPFFGWINCEGNCSGSYGSFQHGFQGQSLVGLGDHENDERRIAGDRRGRGDARGEELANPVGHHQASIIVQSLGPGEEGKRVALIAHAQKQNVEARELPIGEFEPRAQSLLVFLGGFFRVFVFAL